ncbi:drug/metabolite transporter (DMT)-like permease [Pseudomonas sp. F-14 TE3623]|uniref:EamA domain-containing protein n=1 Tax=Pseudomonas farris TaxID=2841207 RepID=A0ABS6PSZ4_9PSED|nr:hypothetical protein [Pseudomonas farris]MBV4463580.1 hypothetical protein [Pseudomonas farris]
MSLGSTSTSTRSLYVIGAIAVFLAVLMSAAKTVYVSSLVSHLNPAVLIVCTFIIAAGYFNIQAAITSRSLPDFISSWRDLLLLNVCSAVAWIAFYFALKFIAPTIVSCLITGIGPLTALIMDRFIRNNRQWSLIDIIVGSGILAVTVLLSLSSVSGTSNESVAGIWTGLALSIASGIGLTGVTIYSKKLYSNNWSSVQVAAHRFYLLIVLCFVYAVVFLSSAEITAWRSSIPAIMTIAVVGIIVPTLLIQFGIKKCVPVTVSTVLAMGPVLTYIAQVVDGRSPMTTAASIAVSAITILVLLNTYNHVRRAPEIVKNPMESSR